MKIRQRKTHIKSRLFCSEGNYCICPLLKTEMIANNLKPWKPFI